jgi:hypothetical protein
MAIRLYYLKVLILRPLLKELFLSRAGRREFKNVNIKTGVEAYLTRYETTCLLFK